MSPKVFLLLRFLFSDLLFPDFFSSSALYLWSIDYDCHLWTKRELGTKARRSYKKEVEEKEKEKEEEEEERS